MQITRPVIQMVGAVAGKGDRARLLTKSRVVELKMNSSKKECVGLVYEKGGDRYTEFGPVILADDFDVLNLSMFSCERVQLCSDMNILWCK